MAALSAKRRGGLREVDHQQIEQTSKSAFESFTAKPRETRFDSDSKIVRFWVAVSAVEKVVENCRPPRVSRYPEQLVRPAQYEEKRAGQVEDNNAELKRLGIDQ